MGDFPMMRAMEDFLINPTYCHHAFMMDDHPRSSMASEYYVPETGVPANDVFPFKSGRKPSEPLGTISDYRSEPVFWRGYASEEEMASPTETDDMSFHSASSDSEDVVIIEAASEAPLPAQVAHVSNAANQQCNKAQAITMVSAGKAKVVSMPKLVDVPASPSSKHSATSSPSIRPPVSRYQQTIPETASLSSTEITPSTSPRSSSDKSPVSTLSTAASSISEYPKRWQSLRHRPSLPHLKSAAAIARTQSENLEATPRRASQQPRTVAFLQQDPYPSTPSDQLTTPTSPSTRKLHKFSSSFHIFGKANKRNDVDPADDLEAVKEPEPVLVAPRSPTARVPARVTSRRANMVPRGANERAEPIVLPPCPEDYNDANAFAAVTSWPAKKTGEKKNGDIDESAKRSAKVIDEGFAAVTSWPARKDSGAAKSAFASGPTISKPRSHAARRSASTAKSSTRT